MTLQVWAWLATSAYAVHVMEEYTFNWRDWARGTLGLPVEWKKMRGFLRVMSSSFARGTAR